MIKLTMLLTKWKQCRPWPCPTASINMDTYMMISVFHQYYFIYALAASIKVERKECLSNYWWTQSLGECRPSSWEEHNFIFKSSVDAPHIRTSHPQWCLPLATIFYLRAIRLEWIFPLIALCKLPCRHESYQYPSMRLLARIPILDELRARMGQGMPSSPWRNNSFIYSKFSSSHFSTVRHKGRHGRRE